MRRIKRNPVVCGFNGAKNTNSNPGQQNEKEKSSNVRLEARNRG